MWVIKVLAYIFYIYTLVMIIIMGNSREFILYKPYAKPSLPTVTG